MEGPFYHRVITIYHGTMLPIFSDCYATLRFLNKGRTGTVINISNFIIDNEFLVFTSDYVENNVSLKTTKIKAKLCF